MFQGFSKKDRRVSLGACFNNERPWFLAHKDEFEEYVNAPFKALAEECFALMEQRYPALDCRCTSRASTGTRGGSSAAGRIRTISGSR